MKRRLVGALVIVLLAIILVPAWLDGSARRLRDEDSFVVPLPPPDNRAEMVEPETIGEQIKTEIPKLEPLPKPEPIVASSNQAVADAAEATEKNAKEAAKAGAEKAEESVAAATTAAKETAAEVVPESVLVDLSAKTSTAGSSASSSSINVEVAEGASNSAPVAAQKSNWIVQVGSFASRENAGAMVKRLKKGKLKAFMRDFKSNGDSIYRVLVGPFARQTEADDAKRTIDRRFQVKSFVANWRE